MNIICNKSSLSEGINIVMKAIPGKTTMEILEYMVIEAVEGNIRLIANDLKMGIETIIEGNIISEGVCAVAAKRFFEIIKKLPSDEIKIEVDENYKMNIKCGKSKFNIAARSSEEFPFLPDIERNSPIVMSQFTLRECIQKTVFSISTNENNKVMTGELLEINGNILRLISLDGHRISIRKVELKEDYEYVKVIIPGKTLSELSKILTGGIDDEVYIYITDKHILFLMEETLILSRLIEGEYYMVDKMISKDYETSMTVDKKELLDSIDRTTILVNESEKKPVVMDIKDNTMGIEINTSSGSMNEEVEIKKEGNDIRIGFNPKFIMDVLRVIDDDDINMYFINPKAPCFIKNEEESYIYLILPVNF